MTVVAGVAAVRRFAPTWVLGAIAACSHGEPFAFSVQPADRPLASGAIVQLTYNAGDDLDPAWLPDGSAFLYTAEQVDRRDKDRCFALMPASGGTIRRRICNLAPASDDSLDSFESASPGPGGRLAFVYTTYDLRTLTPYRTRDLVVGTLEVPLTNANRLYGFPYRAAGGVLHYSAWHIRWLTPTSFLYVAITPHYPQPCKVCRRDAATPAQLVLVDLSGPEPVTRALPNTRYATSFALQDGHTVLFTVLGDGRVFRLSLSGGETSVFHDFGLIARGVEVHGNRLVAIVGGSVSVELLPNLGYVQNDDGGEIHLLALDGGADTVLATGGLEFRHPALSPDGRFLLAESLSAGQWDIWRLELP